MAMTALKVYEAIKHPPLKRHIERFGGVIYETNSEMFAILENGESLQ
jgi:hypothetical protein